MATITTPTKKGRAKEKQRDGYGDVVVVALSVASMEIFGTSKCFEKTAGKPKRPPFACTCLLFYSSLHPRLDVDLTRDLLTCLPRRAITSLDYRHLHMPCRSLITTLTTPKTWDICFLEPLAHLISVHAFFSCKLISFLEWNIGTQLHEILYAKVPRCSASDEKPFLVVWPRLVCWPRCTVSTAQILRRKSIDTPWLSMSKSSTYTPSNGASTPQPSFDSNPPTVAAFSPSTTSTYSATSKQRSTIIVHKKSPLLVATPPQITRALAHSHPFLLPLNKVAGLLSWSTDDPWESYLLVAAFWGTTLYGDAVLRFATPIIIVTLLILGMYSRRYSPLSSTTRTGEKHEVKGHKREQSESSLSHHKSLDEMVDTVQEFTTRCNILLGPFLALTDFLSTQRTPTSATTRPALTTLFIRILLVTPLWIALTLPPFYILTARRIILTFGTLMLTWHSRPARVSRVILWRSVFLRQIASFVTSFDFEPSTANDSFRPPLPPRDKKSQTNLAFEMATKRRPNSSGVRFTFILYENQRRWIGLGWTTSLFAYERGPWTDEHHHPAPSKDEFDLPDVEGKQARWRWVDGSSWQIENGDSDQQQRNASQGKVGKSGSSVKTASGDGGGWIYYDNKWNEGKREDGWGRYTRRRKWYRDAELVEVTSSTEVSPARTPLQGQGQSDTEEEKINKAKAFAEKLAAAAHPDADARQQVASTEKKEIGKDKERDAASITSAKTKRKTGWFSKKEKDTPANRPRSDSKSSSGKNTGALSTNSVGSNVGKEDDHMDRWRDADRTSHTRYGVGEDVVMGLG